MGIQNDFFPEDIIEMRALSPVISDYDHYVIAFSGGKDSIACLLHLLDLKVDKSKIVLLHHDIDGEESTLMDWPCTKSYCQKIADDLGIVIRFSWKVGGFEGEMLRENALTKPVRFECSSGVIKQVGGERGKLNTRRMFPQLSASLTTRWCSAYNKIDVGKKVLIHDPMFSQGKILFITGERAAESSARSKYDTFGPHEADNRFGKHVKRYIDHWRPVHSWDEKAVWSIMEKHRILAHPAYYCGWGRCSCLSCIFGSKNQWATIRKFMNNEFIKIADYEAEFGVTIHRTLTVNELADKGVAYNVEARWLKLAMSRTFKENTIVDAWILPEGAYGESNGPT